MYYVTGISAAGKSAVQKELFQRGFIAYDGDDNGITQWIDKTTGATVDSENRIEDKNGSKSGGYDWNMSKARLLELAMKANKKPIFVCGTASNRYELWDLF
ncbi:MAG: hypothetical protein ABI716_03545, partial [Candidatus Saccharibacteria bacterium]